MSQFVIYVKLETYLAQWATAHFGSPVVFPPQSAENAIIRAFVTKTPKGALPQLADGSLTAFAIPDSKAKPPQYYNYMGERGKRAVREAVKDLFLRALWADLSPLENSPVGLNARIAAWCEANGIDDERTEAVRQCYYRIRDAYWKTGVNLKNLNKKSGTSAPES